MIPVILEKRQTKVRAGQVFNKLIAYVNGNIEQGPLQAFSQEQKFEDILNYTTDHILDRRSQDKCIAIRTHGITDLSSASIEMNAVAARNTRCKDPAFHFVLAWPEHEKPHVDSIFDAAEHAIKTLGLADHQYVLAIHTNTDNIHCHAAVNRVHPDTFKSHNIEWAHKTIHLAARQSEIKHGWTHDNGIYIVKLDGRNKKSIILNPDHDRTSQTHHRQEKALDILPTWHDPDSLDSWLKFRVAKALKQALPSLTSWQALHAWLDNFGITLTDTGGGGTRLYATSPETGEVIDLPVSKGLRILKRLELEKRWGKFSNEQPVASTISAPLTPGLTADEASSGTALKADADHIEVSRGRDSSKREVRREQRAAARADLRRRFSQYQRFVSEGDVDYFKRVGEIRLDRRQSLRNIDDEEKALRLAARPSGTTNIKVSLLKMAAIHFEVSRRKLETDAVFQTRMHSLRSTRLPPLVWREWLYEQANLGDQAALSALRGIVYQAKRDAKRGKSISTYADPAEQQFQSAIARLLDEERKEVAIRPARSDVMRPYEADALLVKHVSMQWFVTGNGNVEYSDQNGRHLFTDRGNRVTFDRILVGDDDIRLALVHAREKFGNQLTLTGDDPVFTARMACLADDMGMTILNPDMQQVIANHRKERVMKSAEAQNALPASIEPPPSKETEIPSDYPAQQDGLLHGFEQANNEEPPCLPTNHEFLRSMVLAIDPRAEFVIPDISVSHTIYSGPVAATFSAEDPAQGFAQHLGRGLYALHPTNAPALHNQANIVVLYRDGIAVATVFGVGKGKER
jgi:hypothetical protein